MSVNRSTMSFSVSDCAFSSSAAAALSSALAAVLCVTCSIWVIALAICFDAAGLLLAAQVDLVHQRLHLRRFLGDDPDRAGHLIHLHLAVVGLDNRFLNQRGGVPGRLGAALRQVAHFVRNHCEAQARFTRPGGFHSRVQRQDVGLEGDFVDDLDDLGDLVALREKATFLSLFRRAPDQRCHRPAFWRPGA